MSTELSDLTTDPSTFFSTSDMDKFKRIRLHHWKERLKISSIAKFESDTS